MTVIRAARRPQEARRVSLAAVTAAVVLCLVTGCFDKSGDNSGVRTEAQNGTASDEASSGTGTSDPGAGNDGSGTGADGDGGGNAIGAPKPRGGGGAKGAPIKLPARVQDSGATLSEEITAIRGDIVRACGGSVCVRWRIKYRDIEGRTRCLFDHIEPAGEPMVERGSTFVIVAGSAECEDESGDESGDQSGDQSGDESGDQSGDPSAAPDQPDGGEPSS